ncbi:hypothetical protein ACLHDG_09065 [Sulfurovum sp. CS9]|uniref:hypothetical protein n=1 Tax=Sulfurovum sp. CS9 TaxID=3391146 RepID=UPI0039EAF2DC
MAKTIDLSEAEELAAKGYSNKDIAVALGVSMAQVYKKVEILEAIHKGHATLKATVSEAFLDSLATNPGNQQMLVKRLGLFNQQINITKPTDAKSALKTLSSAVKQYSDGEISESQLRTLEAVLNSYIKGHEITELEDRILKLEEVSNGK